MDIPEEKDAYLSGLLAREAISQDEFDDIIFRPSVNTFHSLYLSARFIDNINWGWNSWQAAKAQAVPEWIEYEKQSPRIDGRYQIFINGEQLAADWESPYGFSSAEDGTAFIQELITHWSVLNNDPVVKAQEQKG